MSCGGSLSHNPAERLTCDGAYRIWAAAARTYVTGNPPLPRNLKSGEPDDALLGFAIQHMELCREERCMELRPFLHWIIEGRAFPLNWFSPRLMGMEIWEQLGLGTEPRRAAHGT